MNDLTQEEMNMVLENRKRTIEQNRSNQGGRQSIERRDAPYLFAEQPNPHPYPTQAATRVEPQLDPSQFLSRRQQAPLAAAPSNGYSRNIQRTGGGYDGRRGWGAPVDARGYPMPVIDLSGHSRLTPGESGYDARQRAAMPPESKDMALLREWANSDPGPYRGNRNTEMMGRDTRSLGSGPAGGWEREKHARDVLDWIDSLPSGPGASADGSDIVMKKSGGGARPVGSSSSSSPQNGSSTTVNDVTKKKERPAGKTATQKVKNEGEKRKAIVRQTDEAEAMRLLNDSYGAVPESIARTDVFNMVDEHGGELGQLDPRVMTPESRAAMARQYNQNLRDVRKSRELAERNVRMGDEWGDYTSLAAGNKFERESAERSDRIKEMLNLKGLPQYIPRDEQGLTRFFEESKKRKMK